MQRSTEETNLVLYCPELPFTPTYSGTILVGEHFCNWLKPPLRITTPTHTLYWVVLEIKS